MIGQLKHSIINYTISTVINNITQSILLNVLSKNIFSKIIYLYNCVIAKSALGSYSILFIYMIIAIVILFILYKIFIYFKSNKKSNKKNNKISSSSLSSILSKPSDYDLNPKKIERKKGKKNKSSDSLKKILTTDLLSS